MTELPPDHEVRRMLADTRAAVLDATEQVRSPRRSTRFRVVRNLAIAGVAIGAHEHGARGERAADPSDLDLVTCYEAASLSHRFAAVAPTEVINGERELDPEAECAIVWQIGAIGQETVNPDPNAERDFPVPDLFACTLRDGTPATFPTGGSHEDDRELCGDLGLAPWFDDRR